MHMTVRLKFDIMFIIYYVTYFSNVLNSNLRTLYRNVSLHYVGGDGIPFCSRENYIKRSSNIG